MKFEEVDLTSVSEDELMRVISSNIRTASLMSNEIEKLKKMSQPVVRKIDTCLDDEEFYYEEDVEEESTVDQDFEDEFDYYYHLLRGCSPDELSDVSGILPSRQNYDYEKILYRMKAEIIKNIKEIKDFIKSECDSFEDALAFSGDLELEQKYLEVIDAHLKENDLEEEEHIENKFVFFTTPSGNIHVFDAIDGIDSEYYERFLELFNSIKNGTFKGVKRFNNHNILNGLCEVKGVKVRVVYARLSYDTYAIISAFVKKTDRDQGYANFLVKHCRDFKNVERSLKEQLDNPEFMELNCHYEEELFRLLGEDKSDKKSPLVKERGDK